MQHKDQLFRMHFDNRRILNSETTVPTSVEELLDSKPLESIKQGENLRFISKMYKTKIFGKYLNSNSGCKKYKTTEEIVIRKFIKALYAKPPMLNLNPDEFFNTNDLIGFIKEYNPAIKISKASISRYKNMKVNVLKIQKSKDSEAFLQYIKTRFTDFDSSSFYS